MLSHLPLVEGFLRRRLELKASFGSELRSKRMENAVLTVSNTKITHPATCYPLKIMLALFLSDLTKPSRLIVRIRFFGDLL